MSIDSTLSSTLYRKKTLKSALSQSDHYSYSKYLSKNRAQQSLLDNRTISISDDKSGDLLTALPYVPYQRENKKCYRRLSELKPTQGKRSDRRNSSPQIIFSALLPNPFRSNKHHHKTTPKDETNILNKSFSLSGNDSMTTRVEPLSSSKMLNGSRTNLSISSELSSTISQDDSISSLFTLDTTQIEPRSTERFILESNTPICVAEIYHEHFFPYFHTNYCGELQQEGPFIASVRYNSNSQVRAIIRISNRNYDVSVMIDETNEDDHILQVLFRKAHLSTIQICKSTNDPKANEKIYYFDKSNDERQNCKIGFIYQRSEQTDESEIFNNDQFPDEMIEFLQILGQRVRLKGFEKYRGDLDIKNDLHGEYSYYTQYHNREMMFNVAPMIPSSNTNGQCVKRKGLVGNSFVCIVFQESDTEFTPDFISGKVTQIYITVRTIKLDDRVYYKIGIWHRNDLTAVIDPPGGIYEYDTSFRDYFLTLLLNAINIAVESPSLRFCISEQRQRLKQDELKKLSQILSTGFSFDTISDLENNSNSIAPTLNDNVISDSERVSPAPIKKRTLSKILSVFTGRSGSLSVPSYAANNDLSPVTSIASDGNTTSNRILSSSSKDPIKRAASVKHRPAPTPPAPPRIPVSYKYNTAVIQSSTLPQTLSHSHTLKPSDSLLSHNNLLNISAHEESVRNRSNSSPGDHANTTVKRPLSTVSTTSKEISDTGSSIDDDSDEEFTDEEKYEHRPTLTELSLLPSSATNL